MEIFMETSDSEDIPVTQRPIRLLLTPAEAARALGISRATLYPMLMRKEIPSIRVGGLRRVPITTLERYIDELLSA
jgi:excisionase family DNA binding protein